MPLYAAFFSIVKTPVVSDYLITKYLKSLCENYMSNLRTHPQPLLLKREGAKTSSFPSFLKVPLLVREGFRVSLLFFTQPLRTGINYFYRCYLLLSAAF
jgi:hypothetical protein